MYVTENYNDSNNYYNNDSNENIEYVTQPHMVNHCNNNSNGNGNGNNNSYQSQQKTQIQLQEYSNNSNVNNMHANINNNNNNNNQTKEIADCFNKTNSFSLQNPEILTVLLRCPPILLFFSLFFS